MNLVSSATLFILLALAAQRSLESSTRMIPTQETFLEDPSSSRCNGQISIRGYKGNAFVDIKKWSGPQMMLDTIYDDNAIVFTTAEDTLLHVVFFEIASAYFYFRAENKKYQCDMATFKMRNPILDIALKNGRFQVEDHYKCLESYMDKIDQDYVDVICSAS